MSDTPRRGSGHEEEWDETLPPSLSASFDQHDDAGVDVSLLRWMLQMSPLERLETMERHARETLALLEHGRRHREATAPRPR